MSQPAQQQSLSGADIATRPHARARVPGGLTPKSDAAAADLLKRVHKLEHHIAAAAPYYFHRDHVRRADSPSQLIELALADLGRGIHSPKLITRLIYRGEDLLRAALVAAAWRGRARPGPHADSYRVSSPRCARYPQVRA